MTCADQPSLFSDTAPAVIGATEMLSAQRPASPAHAALRRLMAQIEAQRAALAQWTSLDDRLQQRVAMELAPSLREEAAALRRLAVAIEGVLDGCGLGGPKLGRTQRTKLKRAILAIVAELLEHDQDPALVALHDKHADRPHAEALQADMAATQTLLHDLFGVELGAEHGAASMEELMRHAQDKLRQHAFDEAQAADAKRAARATKRAAKRGPEAADRQAQQQRQAAEAAAAINQSVRDVFRKLASALHPDREPDGDARARKTALMQRVNTAYAQRDLLTLLQLQLEAEEIAATAPATLSDERLVHFNAVLRDQLRELEVELQRYRERYAAAAAGLGARGCTPASAEAAFDADLAEHRRRLQAVRDDLVAVADPVRLRDFITALPAPPRRSAATSWSDNGMPDAGGGAAATAARPPSAPRRRRR